MTSHRARPKPVAFALDYARADLLSQALFEQSMSLQRSLRIMKSDPKPSPEDLFHIEETENQFSLCKAMRKEALEILATFKDE